MRPPFQQLNGNHLKKMVAVGRGERDKADCPVVRGEADIKVPSKHYGHTILQLGCGEKIGNISRMTPINYESTIKKTFHPSLKYIVNYLANEWPK